MKMILTFPCREEIVVMVVNNIFFNFFLLGGRFSFTRFAKGDKCRNILHLPVGYILQWLMVNRWQQYISVFRCSETAAKSKKGEEFVFSVLRAEKNIRFGQIRIHA